MKIGGICIDPPMWKSAYTVSIIDEDSVYLAEFGLIVWTGS